MSLKKHLTNVAVDSVMDYLKEKLEKLKQLDLDADGDREKLADACTELGSGMKKLGHLLQLGVHEMKAGKMNE